VRLTPLGAQLACLPLDPRLGKLLLLVRVRVRVNQL